MEEKNKLAAQPQGDPVVLFESVIGKNPQAFLTEPVYQVTESEVLEFARLLAEQPAPVAVVIDDNVEFEKWWMSTPILRKQKIQIAQEAWFARSNLSK